MSHVYSNSFNSNKEFASKKCSKPSFMCSINPAGIFCKNCDFTLSVVLGDPRSVSWVGKKRCDESFQAGPCLKTIIETCSKTLSLLIYFDIGNTVEPPLKATSLQQPFFARTVHTFTLVSTSLQWPLLLLSPGWRL